MRILICSATPFEIAPLLNHLSENFTAVSDFHFKKGELEVLVLVTGVGSTFTALRLGNLLGRERFELAVNAGIAGAFNRDLKMGEVVNVISERFADLGVEEADGKFTDVHELDLISSNEPPFQNGELLNLSAAEFDFLPKCKGLTVNKVHGFLPNIEAIQNKYPADAESMEGAAFFLACLLANLPFLEVRAISNHVEPRNREAWDLPLAIENLNEVLINLVNSFLG
ncbi:MAG: futalosine hydrolase [Bacteroidota bacterium]